jgi:hypothetical protein
MSVEGRIRLLILIWSAWATDRLVNYCELQFWFDESYVCALLVRAAFDHG